MARPSLNAVETVLASPAIAVVGVSADPKKFGSVVYRELKSRGRKVVPVHPTRGSVDGDRCYPSVASLPPEVTAVVTVVPPPVTERIVDECIAHGIRAVWMQQGSASDAAVRKAKQAGMAVVHGHCVLMFLEPVTSIHRVHRFFWKLLGRYPR
jgi:uncharacterized protein